MDTPTRNVLSLCSGYGGLDLGLSMAGVSTRTVCYVEREAYAAANLASLMQAGKLDAAPIWSDLTTFDGKPWCGAVDILTAGFPCQPHSVAGKRKGKQDARWLWDDIARIIGECQPHSVIIENVPGLLRSGLRDVLRDLALLGFDAVWTRRSASEAGAPHRRSRIFLLAYTDRSDLRQQPGWISRSGGQGALQPEFAGEAVADPHSSDSYRGSKVEGRQPQGGETSQRASVGYPLENVADSDCGGQQGQRVGGVLDGQWQALGDDLDGRGCAPAELGDADCEGLEGRVRPLARGAHQRVAWAPSPADVEGWREFVRQGGPEPAIRRDADGSASRVDRLRLLGNGVVPQQAALAIRELMTYMQEV